MERKKAGVRTKIIVPTTVAALVSIGLVVVILIVLFTINLNKEINTQGEKILSENEYRIHDFMAGPEEAVTIASTLYENITVSGMGREEMIRTLKDIMSSNPHFMGVWLGYEPNAFDGNDSAYKGAEDLGSDKDGRFTPCVILENGELVVSSMEVDGQDFYDNAKANRKLHVTSPFSYDYGTRTVDVVSVCMPVIIDNNLVGVCGVDISLEDIKKKITDYKLYKTGHVRLMFGDGSYVAHEQDSFLNTVNSSSIVEKAIQQEGIFKEKTNGKLYIYSQIQSDKSDAKWIVELVIPLKEANLPIYISIITAIIISLMAIGVILYVLVKIGRDIEETIVEPVKHLSEAAQKMSLGDLDIVLNPKGDDEIAHLTRAFQRMIDDTHVQAENLREIAEGNLNLMVEPRSEKDVLGNSIIHMLDKLNHIFGHMNRASMQLNSSSAQIAGGSQSLAESATNQAAVIGNLYNKLKELSEKTILNTSQTEQAASLSVSVMNNAQEGRKQMDYMMEAVSEIAEANQAINQVMEVIDAIAYKTNLLAMNASIEAARAGEAGKGFAVVANEVQNLASQSGEAAKNTRELILNSIKKAELGAKISTDTAASLADIVNGISETNEIVAKITQFMTEQKDDIITITKDVDEIGSVVQSVSAAAEESAAASEEVSSQATSMSDYIAEYKLHK